MSFLPPRPASESAGVVNSFNPECSEFFLDQTTPSLPGILVGGTVKDQKRYKLICQKYKNSYRFATLYDTTNKIPVFSAYTFTGLPMGIRRDKWMIEPQLNGENNNINNDINNNDNKEMILDEGKGEDPYPHQAGNNNYMGKVGEKNLSRGHLFPCLHAHDQDTKDSTFTLTNIVPQVGSFNSGSWNKMEREVNKTLTNNCKDANNKIKAYVVTGAVPSTNNKLNNSVNIPSLLWTAYCCYNSKNKTWIAKAHWGENQGEGKGKTLPSNTTAELYEMLNQHYPGGVQVFPDDCQNGKKGDTGRSGERCVVKGSRKRPRGKEDELEGSRKKPRLTVDIPKTLPLVGGDVHDHCVYDDDDECVCSSVGIKGHYLPVVLFSVLVMRML